LQRNYLHLLHDPPVQSTTFDVGLGTGIPEPALRR